MAPTVMDTIYERYSVVFGMLCIAPLHAGVRMPVIARAGDTPELIAVTGNGPRLAQQLTICLRSMAAEAVHTSI